MEKAETLSRFKYVRMVIHAQMSWNDCAVVCMDDGCGFFNRFLYTAAAQTIHKDSQAYPVVLPTYSFSRRSEMLRRSCSSSFKRPAIFEQACIAVV